MTETVANSFKDTYTRSVQVVTDFLPNVLAALAIILVGWLVAFLLSKIAGFVAAKATKGLAHIKWLQNRSNQAPILQAIPTIVSKSVFWIVLLFSIAASGEVLGLSFASSILAQATGYLPRILVAVLIVILGILIAGTVGHLVERSLSRIGATYGDALGKVTQILIVILASIIGIEQLGINGTALTIIFSIVFGTSLGATALAFGLGAKTIIANMLSIQQVVKNYSIGDAVAIGELEGRILDFTQTAVLLETKRGRVLVPGKRFSEDFSIRIDSQSQMNTATQLSSAYLVSYPNEAASILQTFPAQEAALFLGIQNVQNIATVLKHSIPYISAGYLNAMEPDLAAKAIVALGPEHAIPPLRHINEPNRERIIDLLPKGSKNAYRALLQWPAGTAGAVMNPFLLVLTEDMTISEAMKRTRSEHKDTNYYPYVVDNKQRLVGTLSIRKLMLASPKQTLNEIVDRNGPQILGSTPIEYFIRNLDWKAFESIPVVDEEGILLGAIRRETLEKTASQSSPSSANSSWADGLLGLGELYGKTAIDLIPLLAQSAFGTTKRDQSKGANGHR